MMLDADDRWQREQHPKCSGRSHANLPATLVKARCSGATGESHKRKDEPSLRTVAMLLKLATFRIGLQQWHIAGFKLMIMLGRMWREINAP